MSAPQTVVQRLLDAHEPFESPNEFMKSFGERRLFGFHFHPASALSGRYRNLPGAVLVYCNLRNGTRDFVGVIREMKVTTGWIPLAYSLTSPGRTNGYAPLFHGKPFRSREEAAKVVLDAYEAQSDTDAT